jgi:hypothetical protein
MTFSCSTCGQTHDEWPPDIALRRPDVVWAMPSEEHARRVQENDDLCSIDQERYFIRGVLFVPLTGRSNSWGIGVWAEVGNRDFTRYLDLYSVDASGQAPFRGTLANELKVIPGVFGSRLEIRFGSASERPVFQAADRFGILGKAQRRGFTDDQLHEVLAAVQSGGAS